MIFYEKEFLPFETDNFKIASCDYRKDTSSITFHYLHNHHTLQCVITLTYKWEEEFALHVYVETKKEEVIAIVETICAYIEKTCRNHPSYRLRFLTGDLRFTKTVHIVDAVRNKRVEKLAECGTVLFWLLVHGAIITLLLYWRIPHIPLVAFGVFLFFEIKFSYSFFRLQRSVEMWNRRYYKNLAIRDSILMQLSFLVFFVLFLIL